MKRLNPRRHQSAISSAARPGLRLSSHGAKCLSLGHTGALSCHCSSGPFYPLRVFRQFLLRQRLALRSSLRATLLVTAGVLAVGLGVTAASVVWLRDDLKANAYGRFTRQAQAIDESIRTQLKLQGFTPPASRWNSTSFGLISNRTRLRWNIPAFEVLALLSA